jgi:multiple sugar transport system permease protein
MKASVPPWLRSGRGLTIFAMLPALLLIVALIFFTVWVITFSFTDLELVGLKSINWNWIGLDNYERLITRRGFLDSLWTSVLFTLFSAIVGQSILGFLFAAALRNNHSTLKTAFEVAIMLGWLLPDVVAAFLWSSTLSDTGLVNALIFTPLGMKPVNFINEYALPVVIIANIWKGTAWSYLLFSAALDSISREITEAAKVDGASALQRTFLIILPMLRSHIATNLLFITIWTFTYFPLIYAMTGGGPGRQTEVLPVFMYNQSFGVGKLGYGSAISVAMLLVVGVLSLFYLRMLKEPK